MNEAGANLVGEHDFATFGRRLQGQNTIRRVLRVNWWRREAFLFFDIEANAFLQRMVRSLVGTLLQVGTGALSPEQFRRRLVACDRSLSGPTAPPHGLCLMAANY
jgi:tRNA pseudouridine38-40 synthase